MNSYTVARWWCLCLVTLLAVQPAYGQSSDGDPGTAAKSSPSPTVKIMPGSAGLPAPLSAQDAVRIGLERNPEALAARAAADAAADTYHSLAAFPSVKLGITRVRGTSTAPTLNGTTRDTILDVGDTLDTSRQRHYGAASAGAQRTAAEYQWEETRLSLAQQIRDAYWSLVAARAQTQIALETLQEVQQVNKLTHTQEEAGASPKVDVIRSSIDVANAEQSYIAAQAAERTALAAFNTLIAMPPLTKVEPADQITEATSPPELTPDQLSLADLTKAALQSRPLLLSARAQVRAADYALSQAKAARLPDVSIDYERSASQNISTVLLGVQLPLLDLGSIHYSIRAAEQSEKQAEAQEEQTRQQVMQQVVQAVTDFSQAKKQAAQYQSDILTPSVTLLNMAQLGYKQGATGMLPVIDAETTLRNARTGYIDSLLALYKGQDELLAAVGSPAAYAAPQARNLP